MKMAKGKGKGMSSDTTLVITVNSRRPDTETDLFDEYLRSEKPETNVMTILFGNKNRMALLEIEKLERQRDHMNTTHRFQRWIRVDSKGKQPLI